MPGHVEMENSSPLKAQDKEHIHDAIWTIIYYNTILGRIDLKTGRVTGN
jgi:hypothetical protein